MQFSQLQQRFQPKSLVPLNSLTQGMHHSFISTNPRNVLLFYRGAQRRLARTLRCGFGTLVAQNEALHYVFFKIDKKLGVFLPYIFFMLPCSIFMTVVDPLNLYRPYVFVPDHLDFLVQDAYWFPPEIPFMLHMDHSPINYVVKVRHIFL
jgi:hypothetical protein